MLRRVARALRLVLFAVGVAILAWLPISFLYLVWFESPRPGSLSEIGVVNGFAIFMFTEDNPLYRTNSYDLRFSRASRAFGDDYLGISLGRDALPDATGAPVAMIDVTVPLWLLAALCFAWPVTSFIIARRRHKRGFPIEPKSPDATPADRRNGSQHGGSTKKTVRGGTTRP